MCVVQEPTRCKRLFFLACPLLSLMRWTLLQLGFFAPLDQTLQRQLAAAYSDFRAFCRAHRIETSQPPFTPGVVPWSVYCWSLKACFQDQPVCHCLRLHLAKLLKSNNDVLLTLKAYNGRCALLWLEDRLKLAAGNQEYVDRDSQLLMCSDALRLACNIIARKRPTWKSKG